MATVTILLINHHDREDTEIWFRDNKEHGPDAKYPAYWKTSPTDGIIIRYSRNGDIIKGDRWVIPWASIRSYHIETNVEIVPPGAKAVLVADEDDSIVLEGQNPNKPLHSYADVVFAPTMGASSADLLTEAVSLMASAPVDDSGQAQCFRFVRKFGEKVQRN